jgi:hypothetical protein
MTLILALIMIGILINLLFLTKKYYADYDERMKHRMLVEWKIRRILVDEQELMKQMHDKITRDI